MTPASLKFLPLFAAAVLSLPAAQAQQEAQPLPGEAASTRRGETRAKEEAPSRLDAVNVRERRDTTAERRDSTAAKIVIGREEIEQYGDTNLGDVLRRLPGVTQGGRTGRGGAVRMRGMAGGYTQMLINGERVPPGFSIEDITPEQVERIEILRAPTAETGTRAIAGTINIVLREALRKRNVELRAGVRTEGGKAASNVSGTRNDVLSASGSYNVTLSAFRRDDANDGVIDTTTIDLPTGRATLAQSSFTQADTRTEGLFLTSRLQWRLAQGEQFTFQPFVVARDNRARSGGRLVQDVGPVPAPYATSASGSDSRFRSARFMTTLTQRLDTDTTAELRAGAGTFTVNGASALDQFDAAGARSLWQTTRDDVTDRSWNVTGKLARQLGTTHKATAGLEWEQTRRKEAPTTILNGELQLADFGSELNVKVRRAALFAQDEWDPNPNWATSLGLRWEGIETRSDMESAPTDNRSSVLSPLAHVVWRWDAPKRDQIRASITQSYRPPTTQDLVSRPRLNTLYPVPGANTAVSSDTAGNPRLKPEVANGFEIAFERYLATNGVLSVNLFTRRLRDVIRNVTTLETVSWASVPRWVTRKQNFGRGESNGVELDAKFRLDELLSGAPPVNFKGNLSVFRSRVDGVPGPDNRLASQPDMTANLGADYRFRGTPLSLGGTVNWTPSYDTRLTDLHLERVQKKTVFEVYANWNFDANTRLRLTLRTTDPLQFQTGNDYLVGNELQSVVDTRKGYKVMGLSLETRL